MLSFFRTAYSRVVSRLTEKMGLGSLMLQKELRHIPDYLIYYRHFCLLPHCGRKTAVTVVSDEQPSLPASVN